MGYAIMHDWSEYEENWRNHGRDILVASCKHHDKDKDNTNANYSGACEKCDICEDSAIPMMNFIYPLELDGFRDEEILKVVKETNCTIMENEDTEEWFLTLCGGGMDLSQDIAFAYQILETWIPQDLLRNVCKQPLLSLGSKNYKSLAKGIIKQLKMEADRNKEKHKEWKESLKNLREQEEAKREQKAKDETEAKE